MTLVTTTSTQETPLIHASDRSTKCCCSAPSCAQVTNGIATALLTGYSALVGVSNHMGKAEHLARDAIIITGLGIVSILTIRKVFNQHLENAEGATEASKVCKSAARTARDTVLGATASAIVVGACVAGFFKL